MTLTQQETHDNGKGNKNEVFPFLRQNRELVKGTREERKAKVQQTESENLESKDEENEISTRNARKAKAVVR